MCEFCSALKDNNKEIIWNVRSQYADDNLCEFVNGEKCGCCQGCEESFWITSHPNQGDINISIEYSRYVTASDGTKVGVKPFSESLQINYCPVCGNQLSNEIRSFDEITINEYKLEIYEKE